MWTHAMVILRTAKSDQEHIHHTGSVHASLLSRTVFLNNYVPIKFHGNVTSPLTVVIVVRDLCFYPTDKWTLVLAGILE